MDSRGFQFKQFFVAHDRCAMKVGTDSILLGSWVSSHLLPESGNRATKVLDIGSGSGLLTLMLAQALMSDTHPIQSTQNAKATCLVAVEPEESAYAQSCQNFNASPWGENIYAVNSTIQRFLPEAVLAGQPLPLKYDVLVSNPPYFPTIKRNNPEPLVSPTNPESPNRESFDNDGSDNTGGGGTSFSRQRQLARHQSTLDLTALIQYVVRFLSPTGQFFCILPTDQAAKLKLIAQHEKLNINAELFIAPNPQKAIKRVAMKLGFESTHYQAEKIIIRDNSGEYSARFKTLCRAYYLNF